jgi:hypothetical protein
MSEAKTMDRVTAIFVDGMGAAAATRHSEPAAGAHLRAALPAARADVVSTTSRRIEQSKSNISVNIRGLVNGISCGASRWRLAQGPLRGRH